MIAFTGIFDLLVSRKRKVVATRMKRQFLAAMGDTGKMISSNFGWVMAIMFLGIGAGLTFGVPMVVQYGTVLPTICVQPVGVEILESLRSEPGRWKLTEKHFMARDGVPLLFMGHSDSGPAMLNIDGMEFSDPSCVYYITREVNAINKKRQKSANDVEIDLDLVK